MNLTLIPVTGNKVEDTLRVMEAAHATYMDTSRFSPEFPAVKATLDKARAEYMAAVKEANPTWIVM